MLKKRRWNQLGLKKLYLESLKFDKIKIFFYETFSEFNELFFVFLRSFEIQENKEKPACVRLMKNEN